jgi:hypothetical protein
LTVTLWLPPLEVTASVPVSLEPANDARSTLTVTVAALMPLAGVTEVIQDFSGFSETLHVSVPPPLLLI